MAPAGNKDIIEDIRLHSDIVETIGRYVPLKKVGNRFKALCPFHKEKSPSFHVDATKQLYHCFGCGASGDVFSFVMQYENVAFPDAARILAERAGIEFERSESTGPRDISDKQALYQLHESLAQFYAESLQNDPSAESARTYLRERDLEAGAKLFQIGYAPPPPHSVAQWAAEKKIPGALLEKAGVLLPSDRGGAPYDRFKGRLMFPIRDEQGRVVGFSGRIMDQSSNAKYVNSPETPLFKKARVLYGLDRARQPMVEARRAILCEGQIDVIRCHLAGFTTAVAPQGTALTEAHALLLKRYADEVVMVFDADTAGQNATLRGAEVLLQEGLTVRVVYLPPGEDPDSLIRTRGEKPFGDMVQTAASLVDYHARILRERGEFESQAGKLRAARAIIEVIQHAPSAVQREQYLTEAAETLDVTIDALRTDMMRMVRPTRAPAEPPQEASIQTATYPTQEVALIELMISHPEVLDMVHQFVPPESITNNTCRAIIQAIMALPELDDSLLMSTLAEHSEECRRLAASIQMTARSIQGEEISCMSAAQDLILNLRIRQIEREILTCLENVRSASEEKKRHWIHESAQLTMLKKKLQQGWTVALPILELDHG